MVEDTFADAAENCSSDLAHASGAKDNQVGLDSFTVVDDRVPDFLSHLSCKGSGDLEKNMTEYVTVSSYYVTKQCDRCKCG